MRIAICDDCQSERNQLIDALHDWDPTRQPECFASGADFLEAVKITPFFDIVFLDIYMPGENGVDIAGELKRISPKTGIVFVTTSREHAVEAFSLHALHYLVKPVATEDVVEAFRRLAQLQSEKRPTITLLTGRDSRTVYLDEIYYIQSVNHAKEIHLTGGRLIRIWMTIEELEAKLGENFLKINRSTIVNMEQIEHMGINSCMLQDGTRLDFARRKCSAIRTVYDNYLFSRLSEQRGFEAEVE